MRSKDKQLEQLVADYATDYADAKDKYKETLAKVHTLTSATSDLGKYGAALDKYVHIYPTPDVSTDI
jgi:DNA repair protein RAD50